MRDDGLWVGILLDCSLLGSICRGQVREHTPDVRDRLGSAAPDSSFTSICLVSLVLLLVHYDDFLLLLLLLFVSFCCDERRDCDIFPMFWNNLLLPQFVVECVRRVSTSAGILESEENENFRSCPDRSAKRSPIVGLSWIQSFLIFIVYFWFCLSSITPLLLRTSRY